VTARAALVALLLLLPLLMLRPAMAAVEINTATRGEVEQLAGLGVATTERVLQARSRQPFADWADLGARVPGLRGKRAAQLDRQGLTVNGRSLSAEQGRSR
jgi:competence protein ComEA